MLKDFTIDHFDIIIQAGQSNSEGYGYGTVDKPFEQDEHIWYLNSDFTISQAAEVVWGNNAICNFSLPFSARYIDAGLLKKPRQLLIIRAAVRGTGFSDNRWNIGDDLFLQMIKMTKTALSLNKENRLIAFLWHQGETDVLNNVSYDKYYECLSKLINTVRSTFDRENLPFIAGDFVQQWKNVNLSICEPIRSAAIDLCENIGNAAFVNSDGLTSNAQDNEIDTENDTIHFSRRALMELGGRYFDEYLGIIG